MANCRTIGRGYKPGDHEKRHPYDAMVILDNPGLPIGLGEGRGFGGVGGSFTLQEVADPKWRDHLEVCGCEWLVELAETETRNGRLFTPEEILEYWKRI